MKASLFTDATIANPPSLPNDILIRFEANPGA